MGVYLVQVPPQLIIISNHLQSFVIALCLQWSKCMLMIECTAGIDQEEDNCCFLHRNASWDNSPSYKIGQQFRMKLLGSTFCCKTVIKTILNGSWIQGFSLAAYFNCNCMLRLYLYLLLPAGRIWFLIMAEIIQNRSF